MLTGDLPFTPRPKYVQNQVYLSESCSTKYKCYNNEVATDSEVRTRRFATWILTGVHLAWVLIRRVRASVVTYTVIARKEVLPC